MQCDHYILKPFKAAGLSIHGICLGGGEGPFLLLFLTKMELLNDEMNIHDRMGREKLGHGRFLTDVKYKQSPESDVLRGLQVFARFIWRDTQDGEVRTQSITKRPGNGPTHSPQTVTDT